MFTSKSSVNWLRDVIDTQLPLTPYWKNPRGNPPVIFGRGNPRGFSNSSRKSASQRINPHGIPRGIWKSSRISSSENNTRISSRIFSIGPFQFHLYKTKYFLKVWSILNFSNLSSNSDLVVSKTFRHQTVYESNNTILFAFFAFFASFSVWNWNGYFVISRRKKWIRNDPKWKWKAKIPCGKISWQSRIMLTSVQFLSRLTIHGMLAWRDLGTV